VRAAGFRGLAPPTSDLNQSQSNGDAQRCGSSGERDQGSFHQSQATASGDQRPIAPLVNGGD
jgi:hypothetical protein